MNRLPSLSPSKLIKALEKAGFVVDRQKGRHVILVHSGKGKTITVPKHGKEIKRSLQMLIIRQTGMSEDEFRKLL